MSNYTKTWDQRAITAGRDTGVAKLPAIPAIASDGSNVVQVLAAMKERAEVREGSRGNDAERVVTQREFAEARELVQELQKPKDAGPGQVVINIGNGFSATLEIQRFEDSIRALQLYRDLMRRLDDPGRFDDLRAEVREVLLNDLAAEAAKRGAEIRRTEKIINDMNLSMAIRFEEVTAATNQSAAGVRETLFASAEANRAQAGKVTQLVASLGNYYQDGKPGRALLEQQMTVTADRVTGLRSQYTLKVQAGGALAGFGIAASEVNGTPSSAFIISADKFAIVAPNYSGGMTNSPDMNKIPFGVDANGIYMQNSVYIKGSMRIDAGGKTLIQGLRGSVSAKGAGASWSDAAARLAVWLAIGKTGLPPDSTHLVIGDVVTIGDGASAVSRMWNDVAWVDPGVVLNGNMVIDGSLTANKIDTRNLDIRDAGGNVVFSAGTNLSINRINGIGAMATANEVNIHSGSDTQVFVNGQPLRTADFVNTLSRINGSNISTFMDTAAIGSAYIGNAQIKSAHIDEAQIKNAHIDDLAVNRLKIAGESATFVRSRISPAGKGPSCEFTLPAPAYVVGMCTVRFQSVLVPASWEDEGAAFPTYVRLIPAGWGEPWAEGYYYGRAQETTMTLTGMALMNPGTYTLLVQTKVWTPGEVWTSGYVKSATMTVFVSMK